MAQVRDQDEAPASWLLTGPAPAIQAVWAVAQHMEDLCRNYTLYDE